MTLKLKTMDLTLKRTLPASPEEVFDAWTDSDNPGTPFSGSKKLILGTPKVDSLFYFLHQSEAGDALPHFGRFTAIDRPRKIQYTWMSRHTRGLESTVTVTFEKKGEDTALTLNHANLPDDEMGRMHDPGWNHYLGILEEQVKAKA